MDGGRVYTTSIQYRAGNVEALYLRGLTRKQKRFSTQAPCNHGPSCPHLPIMHYSSDGNLHLGFVLDSGVVRPKEPPPG
jgi:hypothetical protein